MVRLNYSVYEIVCPHCAESVYVDYHDCLDEKTIKCPACGKKIKSAEVLESSVVINDEMPVYDLDEIASEY